jgi:hypothetical protein
MSRTLTTAVANALAGEVVPALLLVDLDFSSGHLYVNNSALTFAWNSQTWLGLANLGSVEAIAEHSGLEMSGVRLTLTGIPSEMISIALGEHYQGRACVIYLAPLSSDYAVLADPVQVFSGRIDTMEISLGDTASITLTAESRLTDWERPRVRRYTHEDQLAEHPGDLGLEFVPQMAEKVLVWGRS